MPSFRAPKCYECSKLRKIPTQGSAVKGSCTAYPTKIPDSIFYEGAKCPKFKKK